MSAPADDVPQPHRGAERSGRSASWQWVRRGGSLVLLVVLVAVWFVAFRPTFLGGSAAYVVVSGRSMEPGLVNGDVVVVRRQQTYEVGDVVAFRIPEGEAGAGSMVIHRIVDGDGDGGYVTRGDNRDMVDPWRPRDGDVEGRRLWRVPGGRQALSFVRSPLGLAAIAAAITVVALAGTGRRGRAGPERDEPEHDEAGEREPPA